MFLKKSKNWFENVPYNLRGSVYNALVKRSDSLFKELDKNNAFDNDGNFIAEDDDYYNDLHYEMQTVEKLIVELRKLPF